MIRPFLGVQVVQASSQPVFGTGVTGATIIATDRFTGTNRPGTTTPAVSVPVTSSVGFIVNDRVSVGIKANFTAANRALLDCGVVLGIPDATHLLVQGLQKTHGNGEYCVLEETAAHVRIIPVNTSAQLFIGTDSTVSSTDASTFDVIAKDASTIEPTYWHESIPGAGNTYQTSQYWVLGAAADTFLARFTQL